MQVDVAVGAWGLYNYYKMEIWKEKAKDLYVLYTGWGRIGSYGGQYQNTPFGSEDQAVQEFEKIFKSKAGNEWSARANFENKRGKYRIVEADKIRKVKKNALDFNLESKVKSKLPKEIQDLVKDMTDVALYVNAYKEVGIDYESVPFGRIKKDNLIKARDYLQELKPLAKDKSKLETKRWKIPHDDKAKIVQVTDELHDVVEKIATLSTEYFYLMPKRSFEFEKMQPLDSEHTIKEEEDRVSNVLEFEVAERFILGAQFRKNEVNPLDYIFKAIGCDIEALSLDDKEIAPHLLR